MNHMTVRPPERTLHYYNYWEYLGGGGGGGGGGGKLGQFGCLGEKLPQP